MVARPSHDSDRLYYFRMPYGGRCRRNRKEQLSAPGFWARSELPPRQIGGQRTRLSPTIAAFCYVSSLDIGERFLIDVTPPELQSPRFQ
jgi:hypothetical protein